jgi:uncharacterized protein YndB with AHSA1/START domain
MPTATSTSQSDVAVEVRRRFAAPRERVFAAWTSAEALKRWHAPEDAIVLDAGVDFRVGGRYQVQMRGTDGSLHLVAGQYREIDPPRRLVLTWRWEGNPDATESLVTVEFLERDGETEIVLTHEGLTTEQVRQGHRHGWVGCLAKLATAV